MTDAMVTISSELGDPDPIDLDRLAASLDHLHAHFCQASAENDTTPPLSGAYKCVAPPAAIALYPVRALAPYAQAALSGTVNDDTGEAIGEGQP